MTSQEGNSNPGPPPPILALPPLSPPKRVGSGASLALPEKRSRTHTTSSVGTSASFSGLTKSARDLPTSTETTLNIPSFQTTSHLSSSSDELIVKTRSKTISNRPPPPNLGVGGSIPAPISPQGRLKTGTTVSPRSPLPPPLSTSIRSSAQTTSSPCLIPPRLSAASPVLPRRTEPRSGSVHKKPPPPKPKAAPKSPKTSVRIPVSLLQKSPGTSPNPPTPLPPPDLKSSTSSGAVKSIKIAELKSLKTFSSESIKVADLRNSNLKSSHDGSLSLTLPPLPPPPTNEPTTPTKLEPSPTRSSTPGREEASPRVAETKKVQIGEPEKEEEKPKPKSRLLRKSVVLDNSVTVETDSFAAVHKRLTTKIPKNALVPKKAETEHIQRAHVIRELISTEKDFEMDLCIIVNRLVIPLRATKILTMEQIGTLFSNVEILAQYMQDLIRAFLAAEKDGTLNNSIGQIMLKHTETLLQSFTIYCVNYDDATALLVRLLKKTPDFRRWHAKALQDPMCKGHDVGSYLVRPVQRLCKYPLLLRELIRNTPEDHSDFENLQKAMGAVEKCVQRVNDNSASKENIRNLQRIEKLLVGERVQLTVPGRVFVREARLKRMSRDARYLDRHYFLFNDLLLCSEPTGKKFKVKDFLALSDCQLKPMDDPKSGLMVSHERKDSNIIIFPSDKERNEWLKILTKLVSELKMQNSKAQAAYSITGDDVMEEQAEFLRKMDRIDGFGAKMGTSFKQKFLFEMEVRNYGQHGRMRTLFLFEDVMVVARKREGKSTKKPLIFEQKIPYADIIEVRLSEFVESSKSSGSINVMNKLSFKFANDTIMGEGAPSEAQEVREVILRQKAKKEEEEERERKKEEEKDKREEDRREEKDKREELEGSAE